MQAPVVPSASKASGSAITNGHPTSTLKHTSTGNDAPTAFRAFDANGSAATSSSSSGIQADATRSLDKHTPRTFVARRGLNAGHWQNILEYLEPEDWFNVALCSKRCASMVRANRAYLVDTILRKFYDLTSARILVQLSRGARLSPPPLYNDAVDCHVVTCTLSFKADTMPEMSHEHNNTIELTRADIKDAIRRQHPRLDFTYAVLESIVIVDYHNELPIDVELSLPRIILEERSATGPVKTIPVRMLRPGRHVGVLETMYENSNPRPATSYARILPFASDEWKDGVEFKGDTCTMPMEHGMIDILRSNGYGENIGYRGITGNWCDVSTKLVMSMCGRLRRTHTDHWRVLNLFRLNFNIIRGDGVREWSDPKNITDPRKWADVMLVPYDVTIRVRICFTPLSRPKRTASGTNGQPRLPNGTVPGAHAGSSSSSSSASMSSRSSVHGGDRHG